VHSGQQTRNRCLPTPAFTHQGRRLPGIEVHRSILDSVHNLRFSNQFQPTYGKVLDHMFRCQ
jgi:hypothetical protein